MLAMENDTQCSQGYMKHHTYLFIICCMPSGVISTALTTLIKTNAANG